MSRYHKLRTNRFKIKLSEDLHLASNKKKKKARGLNPPIVDKHGVHLHHTPPRSRRLLHLTSQHLKICMAASQGEQHSLDNTVFFAGERVAACSTSSVFHPCVSPDVEELSSPTSCPTPQPHHKHSCLQGSTFR